MRTEFGSKEHKDRETGDKQIMRKFYFSLNIIRMIKRKRKRWVGMGESGNAHNPETGRQDTTPEK